MRSSRCFEAVRGDATILSAGRRTRDLRDLGLITNSRLLGNSLHCRFRQSDPGSEAANDCYGENAET